MGTCQGKSLTAAEKAEAVASAKVAKQLNDSQQKDSMIHKLLLLGAGESGKSTLFKQMIQLYGKGFSVEERIGFRSIIYQNCLTAVQVLLFQADERKVRLGAAATAAKDQLADVTERGDGRLTDEVAQALAAVWKDSVIREVYAKRAEYQLADSTQYYLDKIIDMSHDDYVPNEQDVLRSRVRTTGIVENQFEIEGNNFKMYDVGGQRNERKKWIHCFENVTAVIFVAAISEYDQWLYEAEDVNRMHEALTLFDQICNSRWFQKTSIILFLNKRDLFIDKVKSGVPLTGAFPDYDGGQDVETAIAYIQQQFFDLNRAKEKEIYAHVTTATDTGNISHVFNTVKDIVIRLSLQQAGLDVS